VKCLGAGSRCRAVCPGAELPRVCLQAVDARPGGLKNAIDWASRPWGENSFNHKPCAVIGASPGAIGTAVAQQGLRGVLAFCNARQMTSPEAYIQMRPGLIEDTGEVTDPTTETFLRDWIGEFHWFIGRVYTALPRET
jgi:chromate reductase